MPRPKYCQLPTAKTVTGRSSSITNAFIVSIIPIIEPTEAEELEAIRILGMTPNDIRCAYCGSEATEWDHLRPVVKGKEPTGYITEIANLVPSSGKCNQSKGASDWRTWMKSSARLSPKTRGVKDIDLRIERLTEYEKWPKPRKIDFAAAVGEEMWKRHRKNWQSVLDLLKESQTVATEIRQIVARKAS
jgi:hypothetical protein